VVHIISGWEHGRTLTTSLEEKRGKEDKHIRTFGSIVEYVFLIPHFHIVVQVYQRPSSSEFSPSNDPSSAPCFMLRLGHTGRYLRPQIP
jgi:hypothetical protein